MAVGGIKQSCEMKRVKYSNLKFWMNKVQNDNIKVTISMKEGRDLVLLPLEEYNSLKETIYLLSGKNREVLLKSIDELETGCKK
ncbi:type II toxin-antitoxin system Phd/YefM family antitoxin [Salegentibacter sp. Hel_I_6]|uniref:type II toxin-antitoxin system Phd/YefM family antitoxin n=1 Tax=Salegentibacter sp. Hel_I_6 TaxID=1250278 RepID=UPI001E294CD5|nr:type II toxin-antitoxin system Phd/YefM family antitoxin [Salegentibacter sp. Hel_I_6]